MTKLNLFSPSRMLIIASHTFTQLVRMKVFYLLAIFALALLGYSSFESPFSGIVANSAEQVLIELKSLALGSMTLFATLFACAATALLIPKDLEDRTLYTILSKPVPRLDYLVGKLVGVLALVLISLIIMDLLLCLILHFRVDSLIANEVARLKALGREPEYINLRMEAIAQQGVTWDLQMGIGAIFFKAIITAAIALLVSTFSSSTLFTIIITIMVYFTGHFTADAREYWLKVSDVKDSIGVKFLSQAITLIFPDFQLYNITDAAIEGKKIDPRIFQRLAVLTFFYSGIYSVLSWFTFRKKEF